MTPEDKAALLKSILVGMGAVAPTATDADVQAALAAAKASDPAGTSAALTAGGYPTTPWLTYLGLGAGALAIYMIWSHYNSTKKLGTIEHPESDDLRPRLRGLSKTLGHFKGRSSGCRPMGRLGDTEKYEFEPEIRLEGHRSTHKRFRKGVRR